MIALHGGVCFNNPKNCAQWCADALKIEGNDVVEAVMNLEAHPYFNCGKGSNLTRAGKVECESCFMSSTSKKFGAVGSVSRLRFPSEVSKLLAIDQGVPGLVKPQVLVGNGAEEFAVKSGISLIDESLLISSHALTNFNESSQKLSNSLSNLRLDTVGAVSIENGVANACSSSGGILLKHPGRLGHSTTYGSAVWCDNVNDCIYSMSVSGCGEALVRSDFSRSLTKAVLRRTEDETPVEVIHDWFKRNFLESEDLTAISPEHMFAGGILLIQEGSAKELLIFHNTPVLPVAYKASGKIKRLTSSLGTARFKVDSLLIK